MRITSFRTRPRRYAITLRYSLDARERCKIYLNAKIYSFCGIRWWRKGREPRRRNKNKSTPILFVYSIVSSSSYLLLGERSFNNKQVNGLLGENKKEKAVSLSPAVLKMPSGSCALLPAERFKTRCVNTRLRCFDLLGFPPFFFTLPKRVTFRWKSSVRKET